jgi:hypothetical protein
MQKRNILKCSVTTMVALLIAFLGLIGYEVFSTVVDGNGIVITASDGASLRVEGRGLTVLTGSAGITSFSPSLLPFAAGLFVMVAAFALIGAYSLFRGERHTPQIGTRVPDRMSGSTVRHIQRTNEMDAPPLTGQPGR